MKKIPDENARYVSKETLREWLKTTPEERLRFIEESKALLRALWDSKTIKIVEKLRRRGF